MIPVSRNILTTNNEKWSGVMMKCKMAVAKRWEMATARLNEKTKAHRLLTMEDHDKYSMWLEGSRKLTYRNCKHLQKYCRQTMKVLKRHVCSYYSSSEQQR